MAASEMDCLVVGCGLSGAVVARYLAEKGRNVTIWERRGHIGGNMYDHVDSHGILVQDYGPHTFHTKRAELYDYMCRFETWVPYHLTCGAVWDGKYTPTPFNFTTVDTFYHQPQAQRLKKRIQQAFPDRPSAPVTEVLNHPDAEIRGYARFLFENDYAPYTAKQWGVSPDEIDPSVLQRVPMRFSYKNGYFDDPYQVMPAHTFTTFFKNLLDHPNIRVQLNTQALNRLQIKEKKIVLDGREWTRPVVYTGALDELCGNIYGAMPYRSLRFDWHYEEKDSLQPAPVVAYPKAEGYTRITEYKKLPVQSVKGTTYAVEYPIPYQRGTQKEPYYPILTEDSQSQYQKYLQMVSGIPNLFLCGRLADFKYYNMDQALARALEVCCGL